ncbi:hypothetical protein EMIHUDRAFT_441732, partial [Emiliania huxleyi CCMP1516]|uniref:Uncharacterized protein n=2 Tax=Emiliania huxleyi TaxID=2903 RepID=A0A0D3JF19_EMIH1
MLVCACCFLLRIGMLLVKQLELHDLIGGASPGDDPLELFTPQWFLLADLLPRILPLAAFILLMHRRGHRHTHRRRRRTAAALHSRIVHRLGEPARRRWRPPCRAEASGREVVSVRRRSLPRVVRSGTRASESRGQGHVPRTPTYSTAHRTPDTGAGGRVDLDPCGCVSCEAEARCARVFMQYGTQ